MAGTCLWGGGGGGGIIKHTQRERFPFYNTPALTIPNGNIPLMDRTFFFPCLFSFLFFFFVFFFPLPRLLMFLSTLCLERGEKISGSIFFFF